MSGNCKNLGSSKCFNWHFTTMRTTCDQNFSSVRHCLLEVLPSKNQKWAKMGPELKKPSGFFWLKSKTKNTQKLKLDVQKVC